MVTTIKGKDKIIKYFSRVNCPFFKLYSSESPTKVISQNVINESQESGFQEFKEALEILDSGQSYILEIFPVKQNKKGENVASLDFVSSVQFSLKDSDGSTVSGIQDKTKVVFDNASLKDQIELIKLNAKIQVELNVYKAENDRLLGEIERLKAHIEDLEEEINEYEEECEEEEEKISGDPLSNALAGLVKEHGGVIIESITSGKLKDKLKGDENNIDPVQMGNVREKLLTLTVEQIIEKLKTYDENLQYHLYKLLLIAEQRPYLFRSFLNKLNEI